MKAKKYQELHWMDKGLDLLLLVGIVAGLGILGLELTLDLSEATHQLFLRLDMIILGIFLADITRTFFKSKDIFNFLKHAWFDLVVVTITIISFSTAAFLGTSRLSWLAREERLVLFLREEKVALLLREEKALKYLPYLQRVWKLGLIKRIFRKSWNKK